MQGILKNHGRGSGVVSLLCVVMMLVIGTVQAVHSHPDYAKSAHHTCSICSAPNAKLNIAHTSPAPVMMAEPVARMETAAPRISRPARTNFVRPPPAA